jgi:D-alanyl-D-alanine carboxypeptidase
LAGTVSAKTVRAALGAAAALGLDPRALAAAHGVSAALTDVDARFAHGAWLGLWRDMERATGRASIGLQAAERLPWGHWDVLDYVVGTCDDFATALRRFERYFALVSTGVAHVVEAQEDGVAPCAHARAEGLLHIALMNKVDLARIGLFFLVPCLGLCASGCSDEAPPNDPPPELSAALRADLQAVMDGSVADGSVPGVALHVSSNDGAWSGAAGVADIAGGVPMAPDHRFRAGSMIKTLVATAVMQAVEDGALDLDDVITDRLPAAITAHIAHAESIDLEMLLGHRSGIPEWVTPEVRQVVVSDPAHVWSLDEILAIVEEQPPAFDPGEAFGYSNTNYVLLGEILAAVEGRPWREVLRERVIAAAGMADTTLPDPGDSECPGCARGYIAMDGEMLDATNVDPSVAGASGGHALVTTTADLARFLEQLRAGALFDRPETLDAMVAFQPAVDDGDAAGYLTGYGLGVMRLDLAGTLVTGHMGGTAGYVGFMFHIPATDRYASGFINVLGSPAIMERTVTRLAQP